MSHIIIEKIQQRERPFLMMDKDALFSPAYSWAEKGMLAMLLAAKSDKTVKLTELHHFSSDGEHTTKTAQKGLKKHGHLKVINEAGRWFAEVYEIPLQTPVLTYETRKKPANKLADILKEKGLSDEMIKDILSSVEDTTEQPPVTTIKPQAVKIEVATPTPSVVNENLIPQYTERLRDDNAFLSKTILDYKLQSEQLDGLFTEFLNRPSSLGVPNTESYEKFCQHFYYWIPKATKAKQQRVNMNKKNGKAKMPTHDEILTELQRGILMIYASPDHGINYLKESVETTIHWIEKAAKLQLNVDADTQKKAEYVLTLKGNDTKQEEFFEYLKRLKQTETLKKQSVTAENS